MYTLSRRWSPNNKKSISIVMYACSVPFPFNYLTEGINMSLSDYFIKMVHLHKECFALTIGGGNRV
jgi:hypothetical protein